MQVSNFIGVSPVSKSDIPDAKPWGAKTTAQSIWAGDVIRQFIESEDEVWKIDANHLGKPFANTKEVTKISAALKSAASRAEFKQYGLKTFQRGRSVYLTWSES